MNILRVNGKLCGLGLLLTLLFFAACRKKNVDKPVPNGCTPVAMVGRLTHDAATDTYKFRTTGGGTIEIALGTDVSLRGVMIRYDEYPNFKLEFWGDTLVNGVNKTSANHESLNGKHIKDRIGNRRTIIFPDGAKITLIADGRKGPLSALSIYDGAESHRINPSCNTLINSSTDLIRTQQLDKEEADGETAGFEITPTGLLFFQIYNEETNGSKTENRVKLGELFKDKPNQVNDYYDDANLGAT